VAVVEVEAVPSRSIPTLTCSRGPDTMDRAVG